MVKQVRSRYHIMKILVDMYLMPMTLSLWDSVEVVDRAQQEIHTELCCSEN